MGISIAAAVLLLIVALLFTKIRLLFQFSGGNITVAVKILFFRIDITEKAETKINKNKYKIKKFRRRRDKVLKKYKIKTDGKNLNEKNADANENTEDQESENPKKKMGPKQLVNMISELFGELLKRFPKYLHIEFKRLVIGVGGKDAADIAIKTGAVMQAVQYLVTSFGSLTNIKKTKDGQVYVYPVFVEGKWCAEVDVSAYIRVGNVLRLGIIFIKNYLKRKIKNKK